MKGVTQTGLTLDEELDLKIRRITCILTEPNVWGQLALQNMTYY